jgi:predicted component of viral defense system (DUF524 family)
MPDDNIAHDVTRNSFSSNMDQDTTEVSQAQADSSALANEMNLENLQRQWRAEFEQELAESKTRQARLERQVAQLRAKRHEELLIGAIAPWAVDVDAVLTMTKGRFSMDEDGQLYPTDNQGARLMENDKPVALEAFFQAFRQEKPYLVRASAIPGTGSFTEGDRGASANSLENMAELPMAQFIQAGGLK